MKRCILISCLVSTLFLSGFGFADEEYRIPKQPFTAEGNILAPAVNYEVWHMWPEPQKYGFVAGFIVGLMFQPDLKVKKDFFNKIGGMTLDQVVDTIDKFYRDYPHVRDRYPVLTVILSALPRYRSGQHPID